MKMVPTLNFGGNCREAIQLYEKAFGGQIACLITYRQSGDPAYLPKLTEEQKQAGKYLVYETPECFALGHLDQAINVCVSQCTICREKTVKHVDNDSITVTAEFANYLLEGKKVTSCHMEGCSHVSEETLAPLFSSKGYSKDNVNANGIVIDFSINKEAIEEYTKRISKNPITFPIPSYKKVGI